MLFAPYMDEKRADMNGNEWCHICFHNFCLQKRDKYINSGNKYENRYCRKQKRTEYDANIEREADVFLNKVTP